ncbi:MAG: gamma-glutamylcyclotransferase [Hyphomicrobium sp.]|nr:gamma-glutamylcyclotransferase [Hyphomicrobium sp.]
MWRPGFAFDDVQPARLNGWHRRFCITSRHHRGTHGRPGLVLGLDRGGVTDGLAYRVAAGEAVGVRTYLRAREQISGVYREAHVKISLLAQDRAEHQALVYLAERDHPSFAPRYCVQRQAHIIAGARGQSGSNVDYLVNTLAELKRLGIRERELERVRACLGAIRGRRGKPLVSHTHLAAWPESQTLKSYDVNRYCHRTRCG